MLRLVVQSTGPDPEIVGQAASIIAHGGIAAIPTDTLYGLAADPFNRSAVERVFALKGRGSEKALPLIAADLEQVQELVGHVPPEALHLARAFWPGPLTLILPASERLATEVTGGTGTVGVRVPAHQVARALCARCQRPLTATSANRTGEPASANPDDVLASIGDRLDLLLDAGVTAGGPPSTIVSADATGVRLIRAGAISWDRVSACLAGSRDRPGTEEVT